MHKRIKALTIRATYVCTLYHRNTVISTRYTIYVGFAQARPNKYKYILFGNNTVINVPIMMPRIEIKVLYISI